SLSPALDAPMPARITAGERAGVRGQELQIGARASHPRSLSPGGRGTDLGAQRAGQGEGDERAVDAGHHSPDARAHRQLPTANCESPTNKRLEHQMATSGSTFDDFAGEYPFADRFLDIDGLRYHYVDEGSGEVLLFVHGNPTWSFAWRNFIKELSPHYRCIAVDHVGCGRSDKPQD